MLRSLPIKKDINRCGIIWCATAAAVAGGTTFQSLPLSLGPFLLEETGRYVVPPNQSIVFTVSGSLSAAGLLACTANITGGKHRKRKEHTKKGTLLPLLYI
ncbi:hypothetical protein [Brevibacillus sp. SKDU10]|uniref:hypothetical protein n=1 Tax=Brevibacillus sp. SKDU10 TaxID=1247872 RepID=UPI000B07D108|nr:hypothetical protein [Brevibacillus sp. SKDU10]